MKEGCRLKNKPARQAEDQLAVPARMVRIENKSIETGSRDRPVKMVRKKILSKRAMCKGTAGSAERYPGTLWCCYTGEIEQERWEEGKQGSPCQAQRRGERSSMHVDPGCAWLRKEFGLFCGMRLAAGWPETLARR